MVGLSLWPGPGRAHSQRPDTARRAVELFRRSVWPIPERRPEVERAIDQRREDKCARVSH